jgi:hypothetical protein
MAVEDAFASHAQATPEAISAPNTQIDTRWAIPDDAESMRRFAKELVALQPDLLLSSTTPTTSALLQQTRTIPIVFAIVADPIGSGFVANFARPGSNVTGFIFTEPTMAGKWLELLKEVACSRKGRHSVAKFLAQQPRVQSRRPAASQCQHRTLQVQAAAKRVHSARERTTWRS